MADIKFSQFTAEADINNFTGIVGYDGVGPANLRITPADLASSLEPLIGPYLPLTAGPTVPLTGDLNLAATGAGPSVGSQAVVFNGVDDTSAAVVAAKIFTLDSTINPSGQDLYIQNANDVGTLTTNIFVDAFGFVGIGKTNPGANLDITGNAIVDGELSMQSFYPVGGVSGQPLEVPQNNNSGGWQWQNIGYKSFQTFVWTNGSPVAYTNWLSATASYLPFDATPLINQNNLPGWTVQSDYNWTCTNAAGGTAGQVATFTLGASGAGTWKIRTCQHWFDQTSQVEMRVSLEGTATGGAKIDIIDQKSTELTGDKIFYGELVQVCGAGDTIQVEVEFTVGGVNPFPSASGNRPIEITFERVI